MPVEVTAMKKRQQRSVREGGMGHPDTEAGDVVNANSYCSYGVYGK